MLLVPFVEFQQHFKDMYKVVLYKEGHYFPVCSKDKQEFYPNAWNRNKDPFRWEYVYKSEGKYYACHNAKNQIIAYSGLFYGISSLLEAQMYVSCLINYDIIPKEDQPFLRIIRIKAYNILPTIPIKDPTSKLTFRHFEVFKAFKILE